MSSVHHIGATQPSPRVRSSPTWLDGHGIAATSHGSAVPAVRDVLWEGDLAAASFPLAVWNPAVEVRHPVEREAREAFHLRVFVPGTDGLAVSVDERGGTVHQIGAQLRMPRHGVAETEGVAELVGGHDLEVGDLGEVPR